MTVDEELELTGFSSPFLGTFFQLDTEEQEQEQGESFRPLSWGLSFNRYDKDPCEDMANSFRPLSWGLSFNEVQEARGDTVLRIVFVPFLGDFLSIGVTIESMVTFAR